MIARHEAQAAHTDVWAKLAAPLPPGVISWRQDGRPVTRDGKHFARFVAYIEANTVRERLDTVVPGEWSLTLEILPPLAASEESAAHDAGVCAFKARLQILGVVREDVGTGKDYKQAATDAFKRVAVRFGVGHELYAFEQNWVQMDGDGKYAKPAEDPQVAYERRQTRAGSSSAAPVAASAGTDKATDKDADKTLSIAPRPAAIASDVPPCPKCGGRMWDNRIGKRNPKAPDFKCRDRSCDGVIWPPRNGSKPQVSEPDAPVTPASKEPEQLDIEAAAAQNDDVPF